MQPASMAAKTDNSCLLPTWPAGAARGYLGSAEAWYKTAAVGDESDILSFARAEQYQNI